MTPIIKSLELRNFLCHKHLIIEFKNKLTLIGGQNGSGKSAIMIAIGIVLGQRANALDRGNAYRSLIKSGETECTITLTLNNHDNFMPGFFLTANAPNIIVIKKKLTLNNSSFSIYNGNKKLWSIKKKKLDLILDFYSLRFENPLNFLTQENSKKFLNNANSKTLYEFFLKGTDLYDMKRLHAEANLRAQDMQNKIKSVGDELKALNDDLDSKRSKVEDLKKVDGWKEDVERFKLELKWAQLDTDSERRLENECEALRIRINENELRRNEVSSELNKIRARIAEEEQRNYRKQLENQEKINGINKEVGNFELEKREIQNDLKEIEGLIEKNKKILDENSRKQENDVEKLSGEIKKITEFLDEKRKQKAQYEKDVDLLEKREAFERERTDKLNLQIAGVKRMIDDNKKVRLNQVYFFGETTARMLMEYKRMRFKGKVIGPIAEFVELKDKKWFVPVSIILRNFLNGYIVFERADKEKLQGLFDKYKVTNALILVPARNTDRLIEFKKNENYTTVLDVISCADNIITNQLIICAGIEQTILIEDRQNAHRIISSRPYNVESAFTLDGDQIKLYGNSISDFSRSSKNDKYYFESTVEKITGLEAKLKELEASKVVNTTKNDLFMKRSALSSIEKDIEAKDRELRNKEINYKAWISTQEKITDDEIENVKDELKNCDSQRNALYARICDIDREIKEKRDLIQNLAKIDTFVDTNSVKQKKALLEEQNFFIAQEQSRLNKDLLNKTNQLTQTQTQINCEKEQLLSQGTAFKNVRSKKTIEENMHELQAKIEMSQKDVNKEHIKFEIKRLSHERDQKQKIILEYKENIQIILENAKKRLQKREEIKVKEARRAAVDFEKYTAMRDYEGKLSFDHEKETLEITMKLKNNVKAGNKSTLSGGERSFAGICMLLAFWPSVCCPVKILDEFDVFMDNMNRKYALKTILDFIKRNDEVNQVILITPLDTNEFLNDLCDVRVLEPPRENHPNTIS